MECILAIDGGGSRTRCFAITREGKVAAAAESGPSNHLLVGTEIAGKSLGTAITNAMSAANLARADIVCVSAGLAGVDYDGTGAAEMGECLNALGFADSIINGDMEIAHAGALSGQPGVLALAGTGSSILGIGPDGTKVKVGGWGPIYGDEGSAFGIAQQCLRAAARSFDGRGEKTALLDSMTKALNLENFQQSIERIYLERAEPREIAALSQTAYGIAEAGDEIAIEIFRKAGEDLAESVAAAINRLGLLKPMVSYQGSVLESCSIVLEHLSTALERDFSNIMVIPPRFKPVIGSFLIGCQALDWVIDEINLHELENSQNGH